MIIPIRSTPISAGGNPVTITASAGIASTYGDHCLIDAMINAADQAMYDAKDAGKDRAQLSTYPAV